MKVKLTEICTPKQWKTIPTHALLEDGYPVYGANGIIGYYDEYNHEEPVIAITCRGATCGTINLTVPKAYITGNAMCLDNVCADVLPDYLYYCLLHYNFNNIISGSAQPQITRQGLAKVEIELHPIIEQGKIINSLRKSKAIINARQSQLQKLDELIKARFVEMFGMPGTDTKGWGLQYLGTCCELNPKKGTDKRLVSGLSVSFVPMPAVSESGKIDASQIKAYDEVKTGFTYFAENDVLFAKITPCMENGKGAVAVGLCNNIGFGSTEFHILRPINNKSNPYWLYSLTSFDAFRKDAADNMTGSAGQRRVPAVFLEKYKVTLPPIELQNQFAAFVEQTDKSKVAVQKSLDEAQLLFDSLMQQYFG